MYSDVPQTVPRPTLKTYLRLSYNVIKIQSKYNRDIISLRNKMTRCYSFELISQNSEKQKASRFLAHDAFVERIAVLVPCCLRYFYNMVIYVSAPGTKWKVAYQKGARQKRADKIACSTWKRAKRSASWSIWKVHDTGLSVCRCCYGLLCMRWSKDNSLVCSCWH